MSQGGQGVTSGRTGSPHQFGTFGGVFTPSILTILGVIMYLRAGFVVGQAGIGGALLILLLAKSITTLTGLSIGGISTNTPVRGGGAYFLISRVLGPEFGGAIGLALFFAQALSVPFYILGFVEAVTRTFPALSEYFLMISLGIAGVLFVVTYIGAGWAIKTQYFIMAVLGISILTFLGGAAVHFRVANFSANWSAAYTGPHFSFWVVFAIYFPAVTGIMAGINMSGDLKDPARSIPRGTFAAIGVGLLVYLVQIVLCGGAQSRAQLTENTYETLMQQALFGLGFLVAAGMFAATLSSALGSFMGAPRVMQAVARDDILAPLRPFAAGARKGDEPRPALLLTFGITVLVLGFAGGGGGGQALNAVAAVVTMFFLYTYGMTNIAAFVESFGANPSFRPRFKYFHWLTALAGAGGCVVAAFLVDPVAALGAVVVISGLFFYVSRKELSTAFGDARRGFLYARMRNHLLRLADMPTHPKNWRPNLLVLTANPETRLTLILYAVWLECGRGLVTLAEILVGPFEELAEERKAELRRLERFLKESDVVAFPEVVAAPTLDEGLSIFLQSHSVGPLKPNVMLIGWPHNPKRIGPFASHLRSATALGMSLIVLVDRGLPPSRGSKRIDIWWRSQKNGSLMIILAHLLTRNWEWAQARIRVLRRVGKESERRAAAQSLRQLIEAARIKADAEVVVSEKPLVDLLSEHSGDASVVFLGFQAPEHDKVAGFHARHTQLLKGLPTTLLICSTGDADLLA